MHTVVYGTLHADDVAPLLTAVVTSRATIGALSAFLAPVLYFKIALVAAGTVMTVIDGAFLTNNCTYFL